MSSTLQHRLTADAAKLAAALNLDNTTARIETQSLLQHVLHVSRAWVLAHGDDVLTDDQCATYDELLQRRLQSEPLAYVLGEREFLGLSFRVTPDTLIPRPETELLVELALARIPPPLPNPSPTRGEGLYNSEALHLPSPLVAAGGSLRSSGAPTGVLLAGGEGLGERGKAFHILDLGTGSGAIALAIAHARPSAHVLACDTSAAALAVARENAQRLNLRNVAFLQSDWYQALGDQRFHLIVSNPPYVADNDPHLRDLRFEPQSALTSSDDGLRDIRLIVAQARAHLEPGGWLLLEHGYDQAAAVRELLSAAGFNEVFSARDLAGIERCSGGRA
jgi:release factor glutamine methyltransferase